MIATVGSAWGAGDVLCSMLYVHRAWSGASQNNNAQEGIRHWGCQYAIWQLSQPPRKEHAKRIKNIDDEETGPKEEIATAGGEAGGTEGGGGGAEGGPPRAGGPVQ